MRTGDAANVSYDATIATIGSVLVSAVAAPSAVDVDVATAPRSHPTRLEDDGDAISTASAPALDT